MTAAPRSSASLMPGTEARMRVSSVMRPSSSGTLRSARMKTRLPRRSTSDMRLNFIALLGERYADVGKSNRDIQHAVGEAPLVVIPGVHLDERAVGHLRDRGVEDRARRVVVEVRRDERLSAVFENAFQVALGGLFHGGIHLLDGG